MSGWQDKASRAGELGSGDGKCGQVPSDALGVRSVAGRLRLSRVCGMRRLPRSGAGRLHPVVLVVVALVGLASVASSCIEDTFGESTGEEVVVFNATDETITIVDVGDGTIRSTLSPLESDEFGSQCGEYIDASVLEARLDDETVVSSVPDEFCSVDPRWEITQAEVDATYPDGVIAIQNQSRQWLTIVAITADGESAFRDLLAQRTVRDRSACVDSDLEVRLYDGTLVASRSGPFCQGDPKWVITEDEVDAAAG